MNALRKVPIFNKAENDQGGLSTYDLTKIAKKVMKSRSFQPNQVLAKQCEVGKAALYIVQKGNVVCTRTHSNDDGTTAITGASIYGPGDYFGERSLLASEPYPGTFVGASSSSSPLCSDGNGEESNTKERRNDNSVVVYVIEKAVFEKALGPVSHVLQKTHGIRLLSNVPILKEAQLSAQQHEALFLAMRETSYEAGHQITIHGEPTRPALYFVRSGHVNVEISNSGENNPEEGGDDCKTVDDDAEHDTKASPTTVSLSSAEVVSADGYFGESLLLLGITRHGNHAKRRVKSCLTVTCTEPTTVSELRLADCRGIFDIKLLGECKKKKKKSISKSKKERQKKAHGHDDPCESDDGNHSTDSTHSLFDSLEPLIRARPDLKLEDLKRIKLLGHGNFGQVWLATDDKMNRDEQTAYALKVQSKHELVAQGQAELILRERKIMGGIQHPFIVDFVASFQCPRFIYLCLGLVQGGELFNLMFNPDADNDGVPEPHAKFYAYCVADAIAYLHLSGYVFRDLKPENIMIDSTGYPRLIDFGFAKHIITDKTFTFCGTPAYLAPEIAFQCSHGTLPAVGSVGYDWSIDHWALGILIYEMLTGECTNAVSIIALLRLVPNSMSLTLSITGTSPFVDDEEDADQMTLYRSIINDDFERPAEASDEACDLLLKLLEKDPAHRIGSWARGETDILEHPWFARDLDLNELRLRQVQAPWVPDIKDPLDTSCFDDWDDLVDKMAQDDPVLTESEILKINEVFADFEN
eukprot:scaffold4223_cov189-Amphora_coffeaeformis.AAC.27